MPNPGGSLYTKVVFVTLAAFTAVACSVDPAPSGQTAGGVTPTGNPTQPSPASSGATSPSPTSDGAETPQPERPASGVTLIRVAVGGRTFAAELYDNPTAHDLADQLPVTITLDDLHGLEKTGPLPRALTTEGVPRGSDPDVNEIGYYAPGQDLVFYYGDVGYYDGIIRIGRFTTSIDSLRDESDGFSATVERA